ncbi:MAG: head maturation protease, ClpP-related [Burkholderiaceae bacterium]
MKQLLNLLRTNGLVPRSPLNVVRNEATGEYVFYLYDVIYDGGDWGVSAMDVISAIANVEKGGTLRMRIKSPGGDVMESKAIVTAMREFMASGGKIITQVDSLAASCASWIALTANEIEIADGAFIMIHKATSGGWGTDNELRKVADVLTIVERSIVDVYASVTKKPAEQIQQWMDAETWFTADEAVANGFATRVTSRLADVPTNLANISWNLSAYNNAPKALLEPPQPPALDVDAIIENNRRRMRLLDLNA